MKKGNKRERINTSRKTSCVKQSWQELQQLMVSALVGVSSLELPFCCERLCATNSASPQLALQPSTPKATVLANTTHM